MYEYRKVTFKVSPANPKKKNKKKTYIVSNLNLERLAS